MKKIHILAITVIVFVLFISSIVYYFIFTNNGSTFIVKSVLSKYTRSKSVSIKKSEGSLARTLIFNDIEINDSEILYGSSFVRIQRLEVYFESFNLGGINVKIHNGRLESPASELIVFQGSLKEGILDGNIYSKGFSVEGLIGFFPEIKGLKDISGSISGIDIYLKGRASEPKFSGECRINKLLRKSFSLSDCSVLFDLQLKDINKEPELNGTISLNSGTILGPKTAVINLRESKISFFGDPKKASLDLKGTSNIEGIKITITLKGRLDQPELKLTSDPPLPKERLLVMLMTNKSWKATEMALNERQFSPDLVTDFVDYFVFSGSGSKIAQQLGISDISFTFEPQKKGIGVKKAITEKINASYAVEQSQLKEEMPTITQKVGGEYKITESISIEAEKELKQENKTEVPSEEQKANDKVMLKFKKNF